MEAIISNLLSRFEKGALSRRGLIQGLTMLAAAGGTSQAQAPQAEHQGREDRPHEHSSQRLAAFYRVLSEDVWADNCQ